MRGYVTGTSMKPDPFEETLASCRQQPLPACPDRLAPDVWREIGRRRSVWLRLFPASEWRGLFADPRLALSAVGLALAVGFLPELLRAKTEADRRLAVESFHFETFSSQGPLAVLARYNPGSGRVQP